MKSFVIVVFEVALIVALAVMAWVNFQITSERYVIVPVETCAITISWPPRQECWISSLEIKDTETGGVVVLPRQEGGR